MGSKIEYAVDWSKIMSRIESLDVLSPSQLLFTHVGVHRSIAGRGEKKEKIRDDISVSPYISINPIVSQAVETNAQRATHHH